MTPYQKAITGIDEKARDKLIRGLTMTKTATPQSFGIGYGFIVTTKNDGSVHLNSKALAKIEEGGQEAIAVLVDRANAYHRLIEALKKSLADIDAEFQAMGGDWKDQPIMVRKMKNIAAARSLLRELEEPK